MSACIHCDHRVGFNELDCVKVQLESALAEIARLKAQATPPPDALTTDDVIGKPIKGAI